jgi:hypothetical protein
VAIPGEVHAVLMEVLGSNPAAPAPPTFFLRVLPLLHLFFLLLEPIGFVVYCQ